MKKVICLLCAVIALLCGCTKANQSKEECEFSILENGNLRSASGVEYTYLAVCSYYSYVGELEFAGSVEGEEKTYQHLGIPIQTGIFAIQNSSNDNILLRQRPHDEWLHIYRRNDLPAFDFSADNCTRLEFVPGIAYNKNNSIHIACNGGITSRLEIAEFLSEIRAQKDPDEAGLYDLIRLPDGMLENCYHYGMLYGFFEEEPNLVIRMDITSYNDLAYSIFVDGNEYVLPEELLEKILNTTCTP